LLDPLAPSIEGEVAEDGFHAIVRDDQGDHRLWLPQGTQTTNAAVVIPLDEHFSERVQSIQRFQRWLTGKPSGPLPRWQRFSRYQIYRFSSMLRAWDGMTGGASRQEIASILLNRDVKTLRSIDWKNAPERRRVIRLLKSSRELIEGGYLRLLQP
jgi:hypothetical protein